MFSSAGYFRSVNCPFFIHGLCHRPYCHFRHAKPGHASSSKSAIKSCLKTSPPNQSSATSSSQLSKDKPVQESSQICTSSSQHHHESPKTTHPTTTTTSTTNTIPNDSEPKPTATTKEQIKNNTQKTSQSKTPSILESLSKLEAAVEEASATLHSTHCTSKKLSDVINSKKANNLKRELAIEADNIRDESVSVFDHNEETNISADTEEQLSTPDQENSVADNSAMANLMVKEMSDNNKSSEIISEEEKNDSDKNLNRTDNKKLTKREYDSESSTISNKQKFSSKKCNAENLNLNEESSTNSPSKGIGMKSSKIGKNAELNAGNDDNITNTLMIDVHDDELHSNLACSETKRKLDDEELFCISGKKHKSSTEEEKLIEKLGKSQHKNDEGWVTNLDYEESYSDYKKVKEKANSKTVSGDLLISKISGDTEKESQKKNSLSKNTDTNEPIVHNSEKKLRAKRQLIDVNFFTSPKKSKPKSQEKEKSNQPTSLSEKPANLKDNVKLKTLRKHMLLKSSKLKDSKVPKTESKSSKIKGNYSKSSHPSNSINSLFESDEEIGFSSDSLSDSEPETAESGTDTLKEIFDSYDPQSEKAKRQVSASIASVSGLTVESPSPSKEVQGLVKKKRVAHNPNYLVQRKTSRINPVRHLPKSSSSIPTAQPQPTPETNAIQTKKRVAHAPNPSLQTSLARPRIPIEYGAKVPQNLRQRYLDKIIDENLRLYATEKEAFDKGLEEEQSIYERATRRPMYLNLCCNAIKVLRSKSTPEFQHEPVPTPLRRTSTTTTRTSASKEMVHQTHFDPDNLTEESTYELLSQYILDEEQLVDNGYPRQCPSTPGKVTFKPRRPLPTPSKDPNRRTCCRCGRRYSVREDGTYVRQEECVYHFGRLFKRRTAGEITTSYQCCGGDASTPGCSVCKYHVMEGKDATDGFMTTIISPLLGNQKKVFGMDCEMCYTTAGLELTRVTVVDWKLEKVYDTFVKPDNPILDYNTRFSGVTQECLRGVKTSIREVQAVLLSMISKDSILVGHSLESDLLALKLVHSTVVDTSVVFPHRLGPPYKRALRTLMAEFVKKIIQSNEEGHDSYEDASASLELMLFKIKEDLKKKPKSKR